MPWGEKPSHVLRMRSGMCAPAPPHTAAGTESVFDCKDIGTCAHGQ